MCLCVCVCVCKHACVCVCVCVEGIELNVYTTMAYPRISSFRATHKHAHTRILKPFEDSERMGLKVDIPPPPPPPPANTEETVSCHQTSRYQGGETPAAASVLRNLPFQQLCGTVTRTDSGQPAVGTCIEGESSLGER